MGSQEVFLLAVNETRGGKYRPEGRQGLSCFLFLLSGKGVEILEQPCQETALVFPRYIRANVSYKTEADWRFLSVGLPEQREGYCAGRDPGSYCAPSGSGGVKGICDPRSCDPLHPLK